ncbi:MAG: hypothetical protein EZS28_030625 [Streblomastix strix]|uniref:Uncharacterized protein n=1 Tax=Streblomastix strix TaxID=222440 RepID=A0A5J4UUY0_9EUKA|nr:MAG: hypothetical protein EZS28_030625 [Streblomastix strix]
MSGSGCIGNLIIPYHPCSFAAYVCTEDRSIRQREASLNCVLRKLKVPIIIARYLTRVVRLSKVVFTSLLNKS